MPSKAAALSGRAADGHIDIIANGIVAGWAVSTPDSSPSPLFVFIDGTAVGNAICDTDRPDLALVGLRPNKAGFFWKIPAEFLDGRPHEIAIRFSDGTPLKCTGKQGAADVNSATFQFDPSPLIQGAVDGLANGAIRRRARMKSSAMTAPKLSVILLDTKRNNPNHYIVLSVLDALRKSARVSRVDKADYFSSVRLAQENQYDLLLALDGEAINIDVVARLQSLVGASALWAWEDPYERANTVALAPLFDYVFTNDVGSVNFYPGEASHLPLGAAAFLPIRTKDAEYDYDLCFVGSAWPNRVMFLRRLLRSMPNIRSRIVLSYNPYLPKVYLDLPESSYVGSLSHPDFLDMANRSRVNLTLHRDFSGDGLAPRAKSPGPRLFEVALAGGYQLVDAREMSIEPHYAAGREVDTFNSFDDCLEKIRHALKDSNRRIEMARIAQVRTAADHTYLNRVDAILDEVTPRLRLQGICVSARTVAPGRDRPRLLFVTHNTVAGGNFGGVEVYQETIGDELRPRYEIFYFRPAQPAVCNGQREYVLTDNRHRIIRTFRVPDFDTRNILTHAAVEEAFARILTEYSIALVHFQHLINHCASLPLITHMLGVPSVFTLQDFWSACTRFNLIDYRGQYCAIADRPKTACDVCLNAAAGVVPGAQDYRRSFFSLVLASYDRVITNSPSAAAICRGVYPELPDDKFITLGLPVPRTTPRPAVTVRAHEAGAASSLNVVFLGNFTVVKGADSFLEAAAVLRQDNIVFTICGRIDEPYRERLRTADLPNLRVEGGFAPGELDLSRFEVSVHLSIWPETYCLTLSEAWKAGVVPIVTSCGALADRVSNSVNGYHVPINGAGELVALLRRLEGNRRELHEVRASIGPHLWLTPSQHCARLEAVYMELITTHPQPKRLSLPEVSTGAPTNLVLSGQALGQPDWTRPDDLELAPLPDVGGALLAPLRSQLKPVRQSLQDGRVEPNFILDWTLDTIGTLTEFPTGRKLPFVWTPPQSPVQLYGWIRCAEGTLPPGDLMLGVRGLSGDLILRPVYLHDRADLHDNSSRQPFGVGFVTDSFSPYMLEYGVYGLEFYLLRDHVLAVASIMTLLVSPKGVVRLATSSHKMVRTPLPGPAWRNVPRRSASLGVLDDIDVVEVAVEGATTTLLLSLRGWMLDESDRMAVGPVALELSGKDCFHAALDSVPRSDVLQALDLECAEISGYEGTLCLSEMPSDSYTVKVVRRSRDGVTVQRVALLEIGPGGTKARVTRAETPTDSPLRGETAKALVTA